MLGEIGRGGICCRPSRPAPRSTRAQQLLPRHGLRARVGAETIEIQICYACSRAIVVYGENDFADIFFRGSASIDVFGRTFQAYGLSASTPESERLEREQLGAVKPR